MHPVVCLCGHFKLRAIDNLVDDAQAGDHLFFYCEFPSDLDVHSISNALADSGHSGQVTNRHNSEEDGKDEGASQQRS